MLADSRAGYFHPLSPNRKLLCFEDTPGDRCYCRPRKRSTSFSIENILAEDFAKKCDGRCHTHIRSPELHTHMEPELTIHPIHHHEPLQLRGYSDSYERYTEGETQCRPFSDIRKDFTLFPKFDWLQCTRYKPPKVPRKLNAILS